VAKNMVQNLLRLVQQAKPFSTSTSVESSFTYQARRCKNSFAFWAQLRGFWPSFEAEEGTPSTYASSEYSRPNSLRQREYSENILRKITLREYLRIFSKTSASIFLNILSFGERSRTLRSTGRYVMCNGRILDHILGLRQRRSSSFYVAHIVCS
jgi:hypothetical protein